MDDESGPLMLNVISAPNVTGVHLVKRTVEERRVKAKAKEAKRLEKLHAKKRKKLKKGKLRRATNKAGSGGKPTNTSQPRLNKDGKKPAQGSLVPSVLRKPSLNIPSYAMKLWNATSNGNVDGKETAQVSLETSVLRKPSPNIPSYVTNLSKVPSNGNVDRKMLPSALRKPSLNTPAFVMKPKKKKTVKFSLEETGKSADDEGTSSSGGKFVMKRADEPKIKVTQGVLPPSTPSGGSGEFASFVKRTDKGRVGVPLRVKLPGGGVAMFVPKKKASPGPLQKTSQGSLQNAVQGPLQKIQGTKAAREEQSSLLEKKKKKTTMTSEGPQLLEPKVGEKRKKQGWTEASKDSGYEEEASEEDHQPWKRKKSGGGPGGVSESGVRSQGRVTSLFGCNPEIPKVAQRAVKPLKEKVFADEEFSELQIHEYQVSNLRSLGLTRMTEVQRRAVPPLLEGNDALVRSQTGSGKTLAYALPLVELLQRQRPMLTRTDGVRAVIVLPTRELALQTYEVFLKLVKPFLRMVPGILAGGEKRKAEKARLRKGICILVGTPGRLLDHVNSTRALSLNKVQFLVLDEADRLLDMGYEKDISSLVAAINSQSAPLLSNDVLAWNRRKVRKLKDDGSIEEGMSMPNKVFKFNSDSEDEEEPVEKKGKITTFSDESDDNEEQVGKGTKSVVTEFKNEDEETEKSKILGEEIKKKTHQTVLLSATLTPGVERLAGLALQSHVYIDAADADATAAEVVIPSALQQYYIIVPAKLRLVTLAAFIIAKCKMSQQRKMLLFCGTQDMVDYLSALLSAVLGRGGDIDDSKGAGKDSDEESNASDGDMDSQWAAELLAAASVREDEGPCVDVEFFRLHGSMNQKERTHVFQTFRQAKSGVLLCTDVAARGLDLPLVDWIVQWTAPCSVADYVHRVGRTARGGAQGHALLFLCPHEAPFLSLLQEKRIRLQEEKVERCLMKLMDAEGTTCSEAAATHLQTRFENAVLEHRNLHDLAVKAYVSYVRFYAAYPRDVREAFCFKALHLGHCAKSFALRDPPSAIAGFGRRQHQREHKRQPRKGFGGRSGAGGTEGTRPKGMHGAKESARNAKARVRTRDLVLSEFSSGLKPIKKRTTR